MPLEPSDSLALPAACYALATPSAARAPRLRAFNDALAAELGLERDGEEALAARYSGLRVPDGLTPLALAYAGHQFGHGAQLGDGRAILLGTATREDGARFDVQLKGAGRTPFSRRGDGRSSLGPVVREFLLSEAMHALGVPTTRALAAVETGETVLREDELPGAILTRVASSHVRVGTFEFFAARRMHTELEAILDFAIARHHPDLVGAPGRAIAFFERVCEATMRLVARWMSVGFIHGGMNTDNTTVPARRSTTALRFGHVPLGQGLQLIDLAGATVTARSHRSRPEPRRARQHLDAAGGRRRRGRRGRRAGHARGAV